MSNLEISRAQRLDMKLIEMFPLMSRGFASKLIEQGRVTVNGEVAGKSGYKLRPGDAIEVDYDEAEQANVPDIDLPILYEDDDCVVIDKPTGVLTHSKGAFNPEASVATWLRRRLVEGVWQETTDEAGNARAGIAHRLDRATSGVMIAAKTPAALTWLQKQFAKRNVKKTYVAVISGEFAQPMALIDMPIERNPKKPQTFRVGINGKPATTEYTVISTDGRHSLVELRPKTGRTHQLRVHLAQLGHPIVGDTLYNGEPAERLMLHARQLELTLPNRERQVFSSVLPKEFSQMVHSDVNGQ